MRRSRASGPQLTSKHQLPWTNAVALSEDLSTPKNARCLGFRPGLRMHRQECPCYLSRLVKTNFPPDFANA